MGRDRDKDVPTPRVTASWSLFRDLSLAIAIRLERAAVAKRSGNIVLRDPEGAGRFTERARWLRWMSAQFDEWPAQPEKAAAERQLLGSLLMDLQRQSLEELTDMQGGPW